MSDLFDYVPNEKSDFSLSREQGAINLSIDAEEIYSYTLTRISALGKEVVATIDGKSEQVSIVDIPPFPYGVVTYELECKLTSRPQVLSTTQKQVYFE